MTYDDLSIGTTREKIHCTQLSMIEDKCMSYLLDTMLN